MWPLCKHGPEAVAKSGRYEETGVDTLTQTIHRVDQIGSLLRPARLLDARDEFPTGKIGVEALRVIEDDCVKEVLARQKMRA